MSCVGVTRVNCRSDFFSVKMATQATIIFASSLYHFCLVWSSWRITAILQLMRVTALFMALTDRVFLWLKKLKRILNRDDVIKEEFIKNCFNYNWDISVSLFLCRVILCKHWLNPANGESLLNTRIYLPKQLKVVSAITNNLHNDVLANITIWNLNRFN